MKNLSNKALEFWKNHDQQILTILALFLTALVSFQAGKTSQKEQQTAKIDVSLNQIAANPQPEKTQILGQTAEREGTVAGRGKIPAAKEEMKNPSAAPQHPGDCAYVASKNSNKYHLPDCKYAAKISQTNKVCFSSKEDAAAKGYQPAKCCIK